MKVADAVLPQGTPAELIDILDNIVAILNNGRYQMRVIDETPTDDNNEGEGLLEYNPETGVRKVWFLIGGVWSSIEFDDSGQQVTGSVDQQGLFGDGSDGSVTFDGSSTVLGLAPSAGVYTLTKDIFCDEIVVGSSATIKVNGYRIFASTSLTNNGVIHADGGSGGSASGLFVGTPASVGASGTIGGGYSGGSGKNAATGESGAEGGSGISIGGGNGGAGGAAGTGGSPTGAGAGGSPTNHKIRFLSPYFVIGTSLALGGGGGGGGGCTDGAAAGHGGSGGALIFISAPSLVNNGTIRSKGGAGGNGASATTGNNGGGGGGGGGAGGVITLWYNSFTGINVSVDVSGGAGGSGGNGFGTGTAGSAGTAGAAGTAVFYNNSTGLFE